MNENPSVPSSLNPLAANTATDFGAPPPETTTLQPPDAMPLTVALDCGERAPSAHHVGERYHIAGEIARGGMGAVLRGHDVELGRDLAIKVLLDKYADNAEVTRRFIEEARIGGQLQHPGIVPVYDIGTHEERPFFTMKLVNGRTLAALLQERTDRRAEATRFLTIALQVAQAVAYAHAQGVIHRDLKPANIMVGAFGEVQVMDWGLAKILGRPEPTAHAPRTRPDELTSHTRTGSVMGTPAYMPPEQANGDIARVDRRADVFALGAILCELLTGQPPYVGADVLAIRDLAAAGDLASAYGRLQACGADAELLTLTRACLAPAPEDRPADGQAVADGLQAYLNGLETRLHQAELAHVATTTRTAEERKRRRVLLAFVATVLLAVVGGLGSWWAVKAERHARQIARTNAINEALTKALTLRNQARHATTGQAALLSDAYAQVQRALALGENDPAQAEVLAGVRQLQAELDDEERDRQIVSALEEARTAQATTAIEGNRFAVDHAVPVFRVAFARDGIAVGTADPATVVAALQQRSPAAREAISAALHQWLELAEMNRIPGGEPHRDWLQAVSTALDGTDGPVGALRAALALRERPAQVAAMKQLATDETLLTTPYLVVRVAKQLHALQEETAAITLLQRAWVQHPHDFWLNETLGLYYRKQPPRNNREALPYLASAVALRPESAGALLNLGNAYAGAGERDQAERCYHKLLARHPQYSAGHSALGYLRYDLKDYPAAATAFRKAIELDPQLANAYSGLVLTLRAQGKTAALLALHEQATRDDPTVAIHFIDYGYTLTQLQRVPEALQAYLHAGTLEPKNAAVHYHIGNAHLYLKQHAEALLAFQEAIKLRPAYVEAHCNRGSAFNRLKRYEEAIQCFREALKHDSKHALSAFNMGNSHRDLRQLDQALAAYRQAVALQPHYPEAYLNIGTILHTQKDREESLKMFQKAAEQDPTFAAAQRCIGLHYLTKRDYAQADKYYQEAMRLDPNDVRWRLEYGTLSRKAGQHDTAILVLTPLLLHKTPPFDAYVELATAHFDGKRDLVKTIEIAQLLLKRSPQNANGLNLLGSALRDQGKFAEAEQAFQQAIDANPQYAFAYFNLGITKERQEKFKEAVPLMKQALDIDPKNTKIQSMMERTQRLTKLQDKRPDFLAGKYRPKTVAEEDDFLYWFLACERYYAASVLYRASYTAEPTVSDPLNAVKRYHAATYAVRAAAGEGRDGAGHDAAERARLRTNAHDWLRAALTFMTPVIEKGKPSDAMVVRDELRKWQTDKALATVRDADALKKLPAAERDAFTKLWADVAAALK